ncbi:RNA recognition motif protein [Ceratobasidium sp. AG-Ba]|nr:RNA recognition motif protein [Ceratobasidium sp. AG-Ba]QRW04000.1 RNA recognition motif protein [Ceratobasidium sp. AG-Ba]
MAPLAPAKMKNSPKQQVSTRYRSDLDSKLSRTFRRSGSTVSRPRHKVEAAASHIVGQQPKSDDETPFHGLSSDEDSSDEDEHENESPEIPGIDIAKLPPVAKDDAEVKRRLEWARKNPNQERGVLYLARIPHGFYEDEMKAYFSQFGDVTRLRLSRNKKTGRSKHYAFIEFDSASVAQIASETMDNYLLMGHILQCKVIPKNEVHPKLWVGSNRKWRDVPHDRIHRVKHNRARAEDQQQRIERRLVKKQLARQAKIDAAGIEYAIGLAGYADTS